MPCLKIEIGAHGYNGVFTIDGNGDVTVKGAFGDEGHTRVSVGIVEMLQCFEWLQNNVYDPEGRRPRSRQGLLTIQHLNQEVSIRFERTKIDTPGNPVDELINKLGEELPLLIDMSDHGEGS